MTAITKNLPWFIKDLGVSIVGKKCYTSLVENLNVSDAECLKYSLSKGLGLGIVVFGSIMKVPQMRLIMAARSSRGISFPAYVLETLGYAITLAYSYRKDFPFTTYGENFFLTLQNAVITLLIVLYPASLSKRVASKTVPLLATSISMIASAGALVVLPMDSLTALQAATLPISLFSKVPQIVQNFKDKSTGQLSAVAVVSQVAGCLARLFTTATEVGDNLVFLGFALALALNVVLGFQMWIYWGNEGVVDAKKVDVELSSAEGGSRLSAHRAQASLDDGLPPRSQPQPVLQPGGKKWSRKVD